MAAIGRETFDGGDFVPRDPGDAGDAGTRSVAVDVHGTGSTKRHAAAELRSGHVQGVSQYPEQRHIRADIDGLSFAVQGETDGHGDLLLAGEYPTTTQRLDENPQKAGPAERRSAERIGRRRMRFPVAAKMALASAGAAAGTPGSPHPPGGSVLGTIWTSISRGASLMRRTS